MTDDRSALDGREKGLGKGPGRGTLQLSSAEDHFLNVLWPNYEVYLNKSTFASTLNLATALYHFHEWLFSEYKNVLKERFVGATNSGKFWDKVEESNRLFCYVHDVATGAKHLEITRSPSTGMRHIQNVQIVGGFGSGGFGEGRYGGSNVVCDDNGEAVFFDTCASQLFDYWKDLLAELTGKTYE